MESILNGMYRWQFRAVDVQIVEAFVQEQHFTRPIAMVLAGRDLGLDDAQAFMTPKLSNLSDPYLFPDMKRAVARIWEAVHSNEPILIHGDYDTDGITSTTLLASILTSNGANVACYLPHRLENGYGFTRESVDKAVEGRHTLVVTVDCGINSYDSARYAAEKKIDLIITDHHEPGDEMPVAYALINPKLHPELKRLHGLAGVGVTFKLCHAFLKYGRENQLGGMTTDLREEMDLVALGTVADIVPLTGENRCLVKHGLQVLSAQRRPGIRALCEVANISNEVDAFDIAFKLAPRLNAAGRLGDATDALKLLQSSNIVDSYSLAAELDRFNKMRQELEEETVAAAMRQIAGRNLDARFTLVIAGEGWHQGVIGIVASKLAKELHRPTVILCIDGNGRCQGSGRSVEGTNLIAALDDCREYLCQYGGHPMATGLQISLAQLPAFENAFEESVRRQRGGVLESIPCLNIDGEIAISELSDQFFEEMELLKPFGHAHTSPVFHFRDLVPTDLLPAGSGHTRGTLCDARGKTISYIAFDRTPDQFPPQPWNVVGTPQLNEFRGRITRQLRVLDVRPAS